MLNKRYNATVFILTSILVALIITLVLFAYIVIENDGSNKEYEGRSRTHTEEGVVNDGILLLNGWVAAETLEVKKNPSNISDTVGELSFGDSIEYRILNKDWFVIEYDGYDSYIKSEYVKYGTNEYDSYYDYYISELASYEVYDAPESSGFKTFMDYKTITNTSSKQYKLQDEYAVTGIDGIRMVGDRYCVALGSYYTSDIGQYFDLILENGTVIPCILADQKDDKHTDENNIITMHSGCLSEFVVDEGYINDEARYTGNASHINDGWNSPVKEVKIYEINVFNL